MSAPVLGGVLLPARVADFQALWYFTIVLLGMAVLVGAAVTMTLRTVRPLWRDGAKPVAALLAASSLTLVVLLVIMALTAAIGAATTPAPGIQ